MLLKFIPDNDEKHKLIIVMAAAALFYIDLSFLL
jgi:hypothetical protein